MCTTHLACFQAQNKLSEGMLLLLFSFPLCPMLLRPAADTMAHYISAHAALFLGGENIGGVCTPRDVSLPCPQNHSLRKV